MKKFIALISILAVTLLAQADSMEIKTGSGYRENLNRVQGNFTSRYESQFPYVCYDKRVKVIIDGQVYLTYKGCTRVNNSCRNVGRAHFGKYPNDYESNKALYRCINARPRFVD